ncbi:MAG: PIN domain-containing protein [Archaeoglobaceae archaeon]|nr:PIN domain-containing protein [Archaeoglobaceae archaeon]
MNVFVDVNIFMDVLEKRGGWKASLALIQLIRIGKLNGHISALTPAIIYFLRVRFFGDEKAREDTKKMVSGFSIVPLTEEILENSFKERRIKDFEDAIQFHSAKISSQVLITRNKRDFISVTDEMRVLTPEEFFSEYRNIL